MTGESSLDILLGDSVEKHCESIFKRNFFDTIVEASKSCVEEKNLQFHR